MTPGEARARFAAARVARLATVAAGGAPRLVPVTFALLPGPDILGTPVGLGTPGILGTQDGLGTPDALGTIVMAVDHKPKRTTRLRRLDDIAHEPRVTLLVDEYDDEWTRLWWARADGIAQVVEPAHPVHATAVRALSARYPQYRDRPPAGPAILVSVTRWSGWSYVP
ncbi:TIGR03668 family PPOX class F420-dependent oxidoreductase [Pseudofrankia inefficax]|uniref:TIGR03668 family PPOX class F420-dependent oxidoreductase n=1 Tax=Pseudofrankia inefficax (strain DSM 45817 / CECT 9037 / DDB 130130 / EuI1c) TaxID=298654 RepID=UPI00030B129B|nr:TIGR03668 family PPOX class F420-dependent oxidoreductase [Pseudofrankia inefficax]